MKRLILSILISFLVLFVFAQNTPVKVVRIENATTAFGSNLSIGDQVYNIASGELWVAKTGVIGTATLTTASASFNRVNGGISDVTSTTASQLTVTNGTTSPSLSIITGAVTNNGTSLTTGGQVYNFVTGQGYLNSETDPSVKAINGLVKSNGTAVSAAVAGTDYLTPTGSAAQLTNFPTLNQNTTGNAATVTTNANMTGDVTSVGNTTTIAPKAVTLAKMNDMPSGSLIYRKSASTGTPEVQTLATLKTDLGLSGTNTGDQVLPTLVSLGAVAGNAAITGGTNTKITYDAKGLVTGGTAATTADIAASTNKNYVTDAQQTVLNNTSGINTGDQILPTLSSLGAVAGNAAITAGTNTKITYDAKGLVTGGTAATTADIAASANKNYVTDAQQTVLNNTSGTNTGDQTNVTGTAGNVTGIVAGVNGGTGVANTGKTITLGGNLTTSGAFPTTLTSTATTTVTLPTTGTLATLAGTEALTGKTINGLTPTAATTGFTIAGGTTSKTLTVSDNATVSGTNTGDETNASIIGRTLTGYVSGAGTISASDNIITAIQKLNGNDVAASNSGWKIIGNAGTTPGTNFIGTTDDKDVVFKRNGVQAGLLNNTLNNASWGVSALNPATTGTSNVAIGNNTLSANTTGTNNVATGTSALSSNTSGANNVATGIFALQNNTTGNYNTATGRGALLWNTTGTGNNAIGYDALYTNTTGSQNTALGYYAGYGDGTTVEQQSKTDNNATFVGYQASRDIVANTTSLSNITAIGYNAKVSQSNSLILGGTGANAVSVGIGNTAPAASAVLDITSTAKGALLPRMTTVEKNAIASPAAGLLVYDNTLNQLQVFNGTSWGATSGGNLTGDVTSVGNATTISPNVVSNADLNTVASGTMKGRVSALTGNVEDLTAAQVRTLLNVADGATNYIHPTGDGNLHVPATSTTNNGKVLTAGATAGSLSWTTPATGTVTAVSVASANGLTGTSSGGATPALTLGTSITGLMKGNGTAISAAVAGTDYLTPTGSAASLTGFPTLNQNTTGTASNITGIVAGANGGTGVANTGKTITLGGNLTTSGAFATTLTSTAATSVTLPTTGTLATLAGTEALTNKTINGLTPTAAATGFTIAGGTTSKTLTVPLDASVSGINTGDNAVNSLYSGLVSNATHTGDVTGSTALTLATVNSNVGTFNNLTVNAKGLVTGASNVAYLTSETDATVKAINGLVKSNGTTVSAAVAGTDYLTPTGSAASLTNFPTLNQNTTGNAATVTTNANMTGDVTSVGNVTSIAANVVSNADLNTVATATIKGRATAGTGIVEDLTKAQVLSLLNVADGANNYVHPTGDGNLHVPATSTTNNGKVLTAGATAGSLSWTTPATGTVTAVSVTSANGLTGTSSGGATPALTLGTSITGLLKGNGTAVSAAVAGTDYLTPTGSAASLTGFPTFNQNTTGTASNVTGIVAGANGGTGVANTGKTITLGGNLTTSGAFATTLTSTAATSVTLPTTGTLATLAGTEALTGKTINGLTPTAAATGFTIAGGTTSKTLTVPLDASVSGTNTGDNAVNSLYSGLVSNATHTGDVTGSGVLTIAPNVVSNADLNTVATATIKGRMTAGTGNVEDLTKAQVLSLLNVADGANNYVHPTSDGNLHVPATSTTNNGKVLTAGATAGSLSWTNAGTGTVTSTSVVTANGISGSVATATTTPAITLTLGAITPTSIAATSTVSGTQLTSTVATGTAPLVVTSTTPVANLSIGGNAATASSANAVNLTSGSGITGTRNLIFTTGTSGNQTLYSGNGTVFLDNTGLWASKFNGDLNGNAFTATTSQKSSVLNIDLLSTAFYPAWMNNYYDGSNSMFVSSKVSFIPTTGVITAGGYVKSGGTSAQFLKADGSVDATSYLVREVTDEFTAIAGQISFTMTQTPSANSKVKMYINGVRISNTAYSKSGTLLTYIPANNGAYALVVGDRIQLDYYY